MIIIDLFMKRWKLNVRNGPKHEKPRIAFVIWWCTEPSRFIFISRWTLMYSVMQSNRNNFGVLLSRIALKWPSGTKTTFWSYIHIKKQTYLDFLSRWFEPFFIWNKMLSSSLDAMLTLSKTTSTQKLFRSYCIYCNI